MTTRSIGEYKETMDNNFCSSDHGVGVSQEASSSSFEDEKKAIYETTPKRREKEVHLGSSVSEGSSFPITRPSSPQKTEKENFVQDDSVRIHVSRQIRAEHDESSSRARTGKIGNQTTLAEEEVPIEPENSIRSSSSSSCHPAPSWSKGAISSRLVPRSSKASSSVPSTPSTGSRRETSRKTAGVAPVLSRRNTLTHSSFGEEENQPSSQSNISAHSSNDGNAKGGDSLSAEQQHGKARWGATTVDSAKAFPQRHISSSDSENDVGEARLLSAKDYPETIVDQSQEQTDRKASVNSTSPLPNNMRLNVPDLKRDYDHASPVMPGSARRLHSRNAKAGGIPSRSEHGTESTGMEPRRQLGNCHSLIDDDPRSGSRTLECVLAGKVCSQLQHQAIQETHGQTSPLAPGSARRLHFRNAKAGNIPSRSEHGTLSTGMEPRRQLGSCHPLIDDDPRSESWTLECMLAEKACSQLQHQTMQEAVRWPSALAYDPNVPGAHKISPPAEAAAAENMGELMERYDNYLTNKDQYLVSATLVDEKVDEDGGEKEEEPDDTTEFLRERSEKFKFLESRQQDLEDQIAHQRALILAHHAELSRLRNAPGVGSVVHAEAIGQADAKLAMQLQQRETVLAEKEAELNELMAKSSPGMELLKKHDQRVEKKKKGGLINKLLRKMNGLDDSAHSFGTASSSQSKIRSIRQGSEIGNDYDVSERDEMSGPLSNMACPADPDTRESSLRETQKRPERFIAPEPLPFGDYTISELKILSRESNVDISGCVERGQIIKKLESAGVKEKKRGPILNKIFSKPAVAKAQKDPLEKLSISELKSLARANNVDISFCVEKSQIIGALNVSGVQADTNGLGSSSHHTRSPSAYPPAQAASKDPLDSLTISELKALARYSNVDISSCCEKSQIVAVLKAAKVRPSKNKLTASQNDAAWGSLSISELKKTAKSKHVDVSNCVEKGEMIAKLKRSGVTPPSGKRSGKGFFGR